MPTGESPARRPGDNGGRDRRRKPRIGLVLTGGGARAAYQVGLVRHLAARMPEFHFDVLTGVSAGAINASFLASHPGSAAEATEDLSRVWLELTPDHVFRDDGWSLGGMVVRWLLNLASGGLRYRPAGSWSGRHLATREDTSRHVLGAEAGNSRVLPGIARNLERGRLDAVAVTTVEWSTGHTVTWVQGRDIETWERSEAPLGARPSDPGPRPRLGFSAADLPGGTDRRRLARGRRRPPHLASVAGPAPGLRPPDRGLDPPRAPGAQSGGHQLPAAGPVRGRAAERRVPGPTGPGRRTVWS